MYETDDDLEALQHLLDRSRDGATAHLRDIINDDRALSASDVALLLTGMKVISLATVTAGGAPRISAVDGHFLRGSWTWSTSGDAAKARHLEARRAVSISFVDHEASAVFSHGTAIRLGQEAPSWGETVAHWTAHYGGSPLEWGPDIRLYRLEPSWMVGYAFRREELRKSMA